MKVGPPDSEPVRKIITKPVKPFGNFLTRSVIQGVVVGDLTGRTSNPEWFANVPADFWSSPTTVGDRE